MSNFKQIGSLNLAKLTNVGLMNVKGKSGATKKCVVIPIEDNDIFVKVTEKTDTNGNKHTNRIFGLGVEVYEKREADQYGNTHYLKRSVRKEYINSHKQEEVDAMSKTYLGDLKTVEIPSSNQAGTIKPEQEAAAGNEDDLPF